MTVVLTGFDLSIADVVRVAREGEGATIDPRAVARMEASRAVVERALQGDDPIYGLTVGVGAGSRRPAGAGGSAREHALISRHRIGQGEPAPAEVARGTALVLANGLVAGWAGVRPALAEWVLAALDDATGPVLRTLGSVGEADLAPLADLAHGSVSNVELAPGEGLALLDANAFSSAWAALAVSDAAGLVDALDAAAALSLEALAGDPGILDPAVAESRRSRGLRASLDRMRGLVEGSRMWGRNVARGLQDPLTFRTMPHVHGALRDALAFANDQLVVELNGHQGNPLVVVEEDRLVSVGNFDAVALAAAMDLTRIALAPAISSSCERSVKLLDEPWSGLPRGLVEGDDGLAFLGIAAQALAAEARSLAQPVSFELVSTSHAEGIEDRMSMAPLAARRTAEMVRLGRRVTAVELVVAGQAAELRGAALGRGTAKALRLLRQRISYVQAGEPLPDVELVVELVASGALGPGSLTGEA